MDMSITRAGRVVHYPHSDGKPMAETPQRLEAMIYLITALQTHFAPRQDVYVSGNQFLYWIEGSASRRMYMWRLASLPVPRVPRGRCGRRGRLRMSSSS
jgi:hypothetical protein